MSFRSIMVINCLLSCWRAFVPYWCRVLTTLILILLLQVIDLGLRIFHFLCLSSRFDHSLPCPNLSWLCCCFFFVRLFADTCPCLFLWILHRINYLYFLHFVLIYMEFLYLVCYLLFLCARCLYSWCALSLFLAIRCYVCWVLASVYVLGRGFIGTVAMSLTAGCERPGFLCGGPVALRSRILRWVLLWVCR